MSLLRNLIHFFNLDTELDNYDAVHENIRKDVVFKGTNLWILIFAIFVASIGLNMNSTAVIIGAMLISPLMGPINGMGYSMATYDSELFKKALKNFGFAVTASLLTSTTYFLISPISTAHSELLARTSPTIYDVLIALVGGMAGIMAISSRQKGNVIPGVAIATALMPPLCTAGYGLATFQPEFFLGAFYLFTINTVFIALASVAVSRILKFPIRGVVEPDHKKKVTQGITAVTVLVLIPSLYFGYNLVQKEKFMENAGRYINNVSLYEGNYLLKSEVNPGNRSITLVYGGVNLDEKQKEKITLAANDFSLFETTIVIKQGLALGSSDSKNAEVEKLRAELFKINSLLKDKEAKIDSIRSIGFMGKKLLSEIKSIYPVIKTCSYAETFLYEVGKSKAEKIIIITFSLDGKLSDDDKDKISNWLKIRLNSSKIKIFYEK